jgi:hypothetical protein
VLDVLDELAGWGLTPPVIMADAGYGHHAAFRAGLTERGSPDVRQVEGDLTALSGDAVPELRPYAGRGPRGQPRYSTRPVGLRQHALAYVVIAGRRYTDVFEWGQRTTPFSLATEIQRRLLPASYTCEAGQFTLAGWLEPAASVGGDTFDYTLNDDSLHVSITDAVGHEVEAALQATLLVGALRNARHKGLDLAAQAMRQRRPGRERVGGTVRHRTAPARRPGHRHSGNGQRRSPVPSVPAGRAGAAPPVASRTVNLGRSSMPHDAVPVTGGHAAPSSSCRPASRPVVFRYGAETRRLEGEHRMPGVWLVQAVDGAEERIEAGMLGTEGGALVALSLEGVLTRAWAPGSWQTVRLLSGMEAHPAGKGDDSDVVVGLHMA